MAGISLVGPAQGQPADILAQQAQLQRAQDLAYAMLSQYVKPGAATIRTGAGNPFGRDVVNLEPIGKVIAAAITGKQLGSLNTQQKELANELLGRTSKEMDALLASFHPSEGEAAGPPTETGEMPTQMFPANPSAGISRAYASGIPDVKDLAKSLLGMEMTLPLKYYEQAMNTAGTALRAGADPATVAQAMRVGGRTPILDMPVPMFDMSQVSPLPEVKTSPAGVPYRLPRQAGGGQPEYLTPPPIPQPTQLGAPPSTQPAAGGGTTSGIQPPASAAAFGTQAYVDPEGKAYTPASPAGKVTTESAGDVTKELGKTQAQAYNFMEQSPKLLQMISLIDAARLGKLNYFRTEASRFIKEFTGKDVPPEQVTSVQTLFKFAMPQVAEATHEFSSRASQQALQQFMQALGANQDIEPGTARNVYIGILQDGLNGMVKHQRILNGMQKNPAAAPLADQYAIRTGAGDILTPDVAASMLQNVRPELGIKFNQDAFGMYSNPEVNEQAQRGAAAAAAAGRKSSVPENNPPPGQPANKPVQDPVTKQWFIKLGNQWLPVAAPSQ